MILAKDLRVVVIQTGLSQMSCMKRNVDLPQLLVAEHAPTNKVNTDILCNMPVIALRA